MPLDARPSRDGRRTAGRRARPARGRHRGGRARRRQPEHGRGRPACTPSSRGSTCGAWRSSPSAAPGPVHACGLAELLDSDRVIFPVNASVLSAFGTLVTPVRIDLARSLVRRAGRHRRGRAGRRAGRAADRGAAGARGRRRARGRGALPLRRRRPLRRPGQRDHRLGRRGRGVAGDGGVRGRAVRRGVRAHLRPDHPRRRGRGGDVAAVRVRGRRAGRAGARPGAERRRGRPRPPAGPLHPAPAAVQDVPVYRRDDARRRRPLRRAGDRRGARDHRGHPPGLVGRGRDRRLARRHAGRIAP